MLDELIDHDQAAIHPWSDDPADDGNAFAGVWHAILIELGIALIVLLLYWLF